MAGSLAVLSDAAHLAADLSAFVVAIAGSHIASLPASDSHTFGLKRVESLAALFSMVSLAILSIGLAIEACRRMWVILYEGGDIDVDGKLMSSIAFIGVCVNVVLAYVLGEDHVHMVVSWLVCYLLLCPRSRESNAIVLSCIIQLLTRTYWCCLTFVPVSFCIRHNNTNWDWHSHVHLLRDQMIVDLGMIMTMVTHMDIPISTMRKRQICYPTIMKVMTILTPQCSI